MRRRDFLKLMTSGIFVSSSYKSSFCGSKKIPKRVLGRTGERLSIVGFGGLVVVGMDQSEADRLVGEAVERGINYFDVAPSYGRGEAEERFGTALAAKRSRVFLACKTARRDRAGAAEELQTSLKRLKTDYLDLYQLHGLQSVTDVDRAFGSDGAMETLQKARKDGVVKYLGFSAYSVEAALAAMERFDFDTVLFPINWVCIYQGNFGWRVIENARSKGVGILAIKAMARCPWPEGAKREYPKCWYQPCSELKEASLALRFTLSQPVTAAIPPGDERLFRMALQIAEKFTPVSETEKEILKQRSRGLQTDICQ
ncbi:MAG: aldo/keto reductase [Armatimonadota bacterium]